MRLGARNQVGTVRMSSETAKWRRKNGCLCKAGELLEDGDFEIVE